MSTIAIIPSRLQSTRFPEKPLACIKGRSMLQRVWSVAASALGEGNVFIATDHSKISEHAQQFGGRVIMTSEGCRNGTERVAEALGILESTGTRRDVTTVINVQGDSPLLPPWIIQDLKNLMESREEISLGTPAIKLSREDFETLSRRYGSGEVGGTFVTVSKSGRALYFSKAPIPSIKRCRVGELPLWKHIGLYAYRKEMLLKFVELDPTPLEVVEQLEQLRALENDIDIHVVAVDYRGRTAHSVDNPSDIQIVEAIVEREGELV